MESLELIGSTLGLGLLAGTRLYATVLATGLLVRFELVQLPEHLSELSVLADWRVLAAAAVLFFIEFIADKIPWLDSVWDAVHTFIRPLGAVAVGIAAVSGADNGLMMWLAPAAGGVGFAGHSAKAATRLLVNHSPEPFSNIAISLAEDIAVPVGAWFVLAHPFLALGIVVAFVVVFVYMAERIFRFVRDKWTQRRAGWKTA